ncbi:UNVERIFIED_CONTAM: hypothetical protein FKN15_068732 [Acipenser sinensis]
MSKLSFRARALDASKPLPVFRCEDLPDLHEYASINRAVPQMPTGMEKEEESEHHLQRAISAQQVYGEKRDNMVIPVPEAGSNIAYYESLYPGEFKMPKQLIHIQPFSLDAEQPDYDMDSEDEAFVNKLKKKMEITPLQFEEMIDRLEKGSGQQNDEASYEKMLKLRRDLSRAVTILEMIKRREKSKRELLHLTLEIIEKRYSIADFGGEIMAEVLAQRQLVKPTYTLPIIPLSNSNQFKHQDHMELKEYRPNKCRSDQTGNWPWCSPEEGGLADVRYRYCLTTLTVPRRCVGFARRRIGRGGRVLLDRAHTDYDSVLHRLDPEMLASPQHSPTDKFASTSETNTSDRNPPRDLSHILLNIKSCRWRHFRPRTLLLHNTENTEVSSRKLYRGFNRTASAQPGTQAGSTSLQDRSGAHSTPIVGRFYMFDITTGLLLQCKLLQKLYSELGLASKMLDSISAQFAASALVTTEQLMTFKAKEDVALGIGVNGILQASGVYKGLHLTSSSPTALVHTSQSSAVGSTFLQPSNNTQTSSSQSVLSHHGTAANSTTQVLIGNSIRLSVPSPVATVNSIATLNTRHIPRTINAVPASALKLAATTNCQMPKVTASSSMDIVPR